MILVAGSANLDFVVNADHIPAPGETVLGRRFKTFPGGKGANQAVACARAGGVPTAMLLALGNDAFCYAAARLAHAGGRAVAHGARDRQPTGTAFICVSDDGENAITVAPGANNALLPEHLALCPACKVLRTSYAARNAALPTVLAYAQAAKAQGVQVVLNAAPAPRIASRAVGAGGHADRQPRRAGRAYTGQAMPSSLHTSKLAQLRVPCVVVTLGRRRLLGAHHASQGRSQTMTQPITQCRW